jgi:hypothetical protein
MQRLLYTNLWKGCVGAWCPSQQRFPTTELTDFSANNNPGTLTNTGAVWTPFNSKMSLLSDNTDDCILFGTRVPTVNNNASICFWWTPLQLNANKGARYIAAQGASYNNTFCVACETTYNSRQITLYRNFETGLASTTLFTNGQSYFIVCLLYGSSGSWNREIWINGRLDASGTTASNPNSSLSGQTTSIGRLADVGVSAWPGYIDDFRLYNRTLDPSEIKLLAQRRGIAYEQTRNRKYKAAGGGGGGFKPYWASHNSASIGCGV